MTAQAEKTRYAVSTGNWSWEGDDEELLLDTRDYCDRTLVAIPTRMYKTHLLHTLMIESPESERRVHHFMIMGFVHGWISRDERMRKDAKNAASG